MNISQVQQHLVQTVENTNPQMAAKSMRMCCTGLERPDYLGLFPIVGFFFLIFEQEFQTMTRRFSVLAIESQYVIRLL